MNRYQTNRADTQKGFTLIELSIVLVIIGLIVGGVLVGQDLIKAAEIRATVSQIEKYNAAANTFRTKYNGLPGDLLSGSSYFANVAAQDATKTACGNGDGLIASTGVICSGSATVITNGGVTGESLVFWYELAQANMIADSITAATTETYAGAIAVNAGNPAAPVLPAAKLGKGNWILVNSYNGFNYFQIEGVSSSVSAAGVPAQTQALTPSQAFQIDVKLDDGAPATGSVLSIGSGDLAKNALSDATASDSNGNTGTAATECWSGSAYAISSNANGGACQLSIRASF